MGSAGASGLFATVWVVVAVAFAVCAGGSVLYLLTLLFAALLPPRRSSSQSNFAPPPRFAVVVPAHDEELVIDATLQSLLEQEYAPGLVEIVVVADNCSDTTAALARKRGVTVLERTNLNERGKGYALQWAFAQLLARPNPADAFVVVDADTWVAPDFLTVMAQALASRKNAQGLAALQGRYGVLNARENWRTALMAGAFDLINHVKPMGRDRLNLSVGLKGNGMAFSREVMQTAPWQGTSITEDIDYGLDLLHHNVRVGYVPDALVRAQMPTTANQATSQRERWEGGRSKLLKRVGPLLKQALQKHNVAFADAATDLIVPPLAELAALLFAWGVWVALGAKSHLTNHPAGWAAGWVFALIGFLVYVLGGFKAAGAPREAYTALYRAPGYAVWKILLMLARPLRRRKTGGQAAQTGGVDEWVRTERAPLSSASAVPQREDAAP